MESAFISQEKGSSTLRDPVSTFSPVPEHSKSGISSGWWGLGGELPGEYFLAQINSLVGKSSPVGEQNVTAQETLSDGNGHTRCDKK